MAKEVLEMEVKSNIGEVAKDTKELTNEASKAAGEFQIMGVSLNGVKKGFASAAVTAKGMFGSIKAGLISTGIGAFVVLIGSLTAYLTNTKKGAELLEKTLKTVGAAISVITDRVAKLGGAVIKFFRGDLKGAAEDAKAAVSGVIAEINEEVDATMKMVTANQKLRDSQRELNVETAQSIAQVEKLKLIAEDITKSYKEREEAATQAFEIETDLENKRISLAEQAVDLELERHRIMGKDGVLAEDLDALSELEINLANVRQESAGRQISLQNFLNGLRNEELAKLQEIRDAEEERFEGIEKLVTETIEANQELIQADNSVLDNYLANNEKKKQSDKAVKDGKVAMAQQGLALVSAIAGEGTALAKTAAVASATISGVEGVQNAFTTAQKSPITALMPAYPFIQAGLAGAFSAIQIQKILSGSPAGGGGGGGVTSAVPSTPAPQMMSGAFELTGGVAPEPTRAYVVTDEMTNSQNQLANIRRRATI